jgi:hypothetical protein
MEFTGFKNTDVAAKYATDRKTDPVVHVPGKKASGFQCRLSELTLENADKLFAMQNQNLLTLKSEKGTDLKKEEKGSGKSKEQATQ